MASRCCPRERPRPSDRLAQAPDGLNPAGVAAGDDDHGAISRHPAVQAQRTIVNLAVRRVERFPAMSLATARRR
jgi:hypothetical protein